MAGTQPPLVGMELHGIKPFRQGLNRADKRMARDVYNKLREVAGITAAEARSLAGQRTVRRTGDLISHIQPFAVLKGAGVRSSAQHGGYPYPRRLEFEGRRGGETGPRASLFPAFRRTQPAVIKAGESLLHGVLKDLA